MSRTEDLRALAQRVTDALPPEVVEVVLTGSVSRGVADAVSDVEMLLVPVQHVDLEAAFAVARDAGLERLDTWGVQGTPTKRVTGYRDGEPLELIFWPHDYAESSVDALLAGEPSSAADALAHGIPLRTSGLLAAWQAHLRRYPAQLAAARIEEAALRWGGYTGGAAHPRARAIGSRWWSG